MITTHKFCEAWRLLFPGSFFFAGRTSLAETLCERSHTIKFILGKDAYDDRKSHAGPAAEGVDPSNPQSMFTSFVPRLVAKHQRRPPGFDDKVISLYARGLPVREIQGHLTGLYGSKVSPDLISTITGEVMDEVAYSGERDRSFRPIVTAVHELMLRG